MNLLFYFLTWCLKRFELSTPISLSFACCCLEIFTSKFISISCIHQALLLTIEFTVLFSRYRLVLHYLASWYQMTNGIFLNYCNYLVYRYFSTAHFTFLWFGFFWPLTVRCVQIQLHMTHLEYTWYMTRVKLLDSIVLG